jgi:pimeloyl-ACP methyl ester carboxylesterase
MNRELRKLSTPPPDAFAVHRAEVRDGLSLAYLHEGVGGYPLLLVHGYPETKRIWWRNVGALAQAGFEVIAPDLRGYGDSDLSPDDAYDLVLYARDLHALVHDVLGHARCGLVGGDVGGPVIVDLALRFPGFAERLVFFNTVPPVVADRPDLYEQVGLSMIALNDDVATGDYRIRQGRDPQDLLADLDTPERRRRYIGDMYGHRLWAAPGGFTPEEVDFMTEPFADAGHLAASWAPYQLAYGRPMSEAPLLSQEVPVETLILYGPEDRVVPDDFMARCELAFPRRIGPLVIPEAGHFLQWERADVFNPLVARFFSDLIPKG